MSDWSLKCNMTLLSHKTVADEDLDGEEGDYTEEDEDFSEEYDGMP